MACSRCGAQTRTLLQRASQRPPQILATHPRFARLASNATIPRTVQNQVRRESTQASPEKTEKPEITTRQLLDAMQQSQQRKTDGTGLVGSYAIYGGTHQIYKKCSQPVSYTISDIDRANGTVDTLEDGEEVGKSEGAWHSRTSTHSPPFTFLPFPLISSLFFRPPRFPLSFSNVSAFSPWFTPDL